MMEYYSFEESCKELGIEAADLKRLVSEGEIRAFRNEDKMKFKKFDINNLKKCRLTEPTVILPSDCSDDREEAEFFESDYNGIGSPPTKKEMEAETKEVCSSGKPKVERPCPFSGFELDILKKDLKEHGCSDEYIDRMLNETIYKAGVPKLLSIIMDLSSS